MIPIDGTVHIPKGLQTDPHFIVPDEVVARSAQKFGLLRPSMRGFDPMCGVGTIPRIIHQLGGHCDGMEIDERQYVVAKHAVSHDTSVLLGDCLSAVPLQVYDYVYTSPPFAWFKGGQLPGPKCAEAFRSFLKPGGTLIIDTADKAVRGIEAWNVADIQVRYFSNHGFNLKQILKFKVVTKQGKIDSQFTELCFTLGS